MYGERRSRVPHTARWHRVATQPDGRVLPDGCLDLIWVDGGLLVAGPDTGPQIATNRPGQAYTGLRFGPGTGPAVLGVPAHELRDRRVPLEELWPAAEVRRLTGRVTRAVDTGEALEDIALERMGTPDPAARAAVMRLCSGDTVNAIAGAVGLSERQLHRRSLAAFGYGLKTLGRILRMRRALSLAASGTAFADVALAAGYADQAHLARDVKALTGLPLRRLNAWYPVYDALELSPADAEPAVERERRGHVVHDDADHIQRRCHAVTLWRSGAAVLNESDIELETPTAALNRYRVDDHQGPFCPGTTVSVIFRRLCER